jgi:hypothetical protein
VFGGLAAVAVLVGSMTQTDGTIGLQAIVPVAMFAGMVGCLLAGLVAFGILQLESAGQPAGAERHLTVWLAVLFATLVGSASLLTFLASVAFPNAFIRSLATLSQHPLVGTVLAAVLAALIVRGVVVPLRRLHPFQSADAEAPVRAEARRRRSRRRLIWTLGVLGVLELGGVALVATDALGVLVLAFAIAAGIIVAHSRAPNAAWPRRLASVGAALGGAACGLGITLMFGELLVIPGSFVAALVAANGVLAVEPRHTHH